MERVDNTHAEEEVVVVMDDSRENFNDELTIDVGQDHMP
jgi:hypothetical protein